jgi:hypothetical protein
VRLRFGVTVEARDEEPTNDYTVEAKRNEMALASPHCRTVGMVSKKGIPPRVPLLVSERPQPSTSVLNRNPMTRFDELKESR